MESAAVGATVAALVLSASAPPPGLAALTEAPRTEQRESAGSALSLLLESLEIDGTLPRAGPAWLATNEHFDIYGFMHADAEAIRRPDGSVEIIDGP